METRVSNEAEEEDFVKYGEGLTVCPGDTQFSWGGGSFEHLRQEKIFPNFQCSKFCWVEAELQNLCGWHFFICGEGIDPPNPLSSNPQWNRAVITE